MLSLYPINLVESGEGALVKQTSQMWGSPASQRLLLLFSPDAPAVEESLSRSPFCGCIQVILNLPNDSSCSASPSVPAGRGCTSRSWFCGQICFTWSKGEMVLIDMKREVAPWPCAESLPSLGSGRAWGAASSSISSPCVEIGTIIPE